MHLWNFGPNDLNAVLKMFASHSNFHPGVHWDMLGWANIQIFADLKTLNEPISTTHRK
uniref:Uncharacterized protein n=1 Tax=Anguilla anguilla TaxID=7936 RepID=A0A0E9XV35_ANGAN